jgi:hypothetical protein
MVKVFRSSCPRGVFRISPTQVNWANLMSMRDEYDKTLDRMFRENMAKLPEADRMPENFDDCCMVKFDGYRCTLPKGHSGEHKAHGRLGYIVATESKTKGELL